MFGRRPKKVEKIEVEEVRVNEVRIEQTDLLERLDSVEKSMHEQRQKFGHEIDEIKDQLGENE